MPSQIELLIQIQQVDQNLRENTQAVSSGESRVTELEEAYQAKSSATEQGRATASALATKQRDLEARLADAESKMKDRRMRITRIRNDKELGLAKREVDLLKDEITGIEAELQQVYEQVEAATTTLAALEGELKTIAESREAEATALRDTIARLGADIERDRTRRQALLETVDVELRRRYEMILSRRGGLAVVPVRDGTCQGCRMRVPPQLYNQIQRGEQVILCPSCQRMLHWQPQQEEASE
ncbi:MAG TPA: C4-type zinc ribbon domain-containing protein [Candidatus Eisenbacteria bacterium]|nr:C4-type zinc ribbon domain-containing protein [Candidatus Eisenbacteria bacterium]